MSVPLKLAAFSVLLVVVFVVALGIGMAVGPVDLHPATHHMTGGAAAATRGVPTDSATTANTHTYGVGR